jgi:hypothetical protein
MKRSIVLSLSIILLFVSCRQPRSEWKGTVEVVDGVAVVRNPEEPMYGGDILSFEEDLSIGASEGKDEYIFSRIRNIDVDSNGDIYAIDTSSAQIRVFNRNGQYMRSIGRKGQGPGEMQMPGFVQAASQNEIAAFDFLTQRLIFFSPDGIYLRAVSAARMRFPVMPLRLDSSGNVVGLQVMAPPPLGGQKIAKYGPDLELLFTIASDESNSVGKDREFEVAKPGLSCAVSPNDTIVWGNSSRYELYVLSPEGKKIRTIRRKYDPPAMTAAFRKKTEEELSEWAARGFKISFPDRFPAFMDVSVDDRDWLWVRTYEPVGEEEDSYYFDIFDSEGKYLAKVPIRVNLNEKSVWKSGSLYTIETSKEGFQMIKRFKVRWKIRGIGV